MIPFNHLIEVLDQMILEIANRGKQNEDNQVCFFINGEKAKGGFEIGMGEDRINGNCVIIFDLLTEIPPKHITDQCQCTGCQETRLLETAAKEH